MVLKRKILLGFLGSFLIAFQGKAQLTNQSFESFCGSTVFLTPTDPSYLSCETFTNTCVTGWYRSHGTPQLWSNPITPGPEVPVGNTPAGNNLMAMWNKRDYPSGRSGEGIFTYKNFIKDRNYRVCLWVNNNINDGDIVIRLAKNLALRSNTNGDCGESIPSTANTQVIFQQQLAWSSAWTKITFDFTADDDYSQFWIYPLGPSDYSQVAWLFVDDINVYEICNPQIEFNMTTNTSSGVVPAGFYTRKYTIDAGSSAAGGSVSSGTVTTSTSGDVIFEGGTVIRLLPNFRATATVNSKFVAFITPCSILACGEEERVINDPQGDLTNPRRAGTAKTGVENPFNNLGATSIYPNPTSGVLNITTASNSTYKLTTITGQALKQGEIAGYSATIDLSSLPNGFYMIELTDKQNNISSFYKVVKE